MKPRRLGIGLWLACLLCAWCLTSGVHAQTCEQKAVLSASVEVYKEAPRYVTGLGWQGQRTDRLPAGHVVWICQNRAIDFGFSSREWSQVGYRHPRSNEPWQFGWILTSQWRPAGRGTSSETADKPVRQAAYNMAEPPKVVNEPPAPPQPDEPAVKAAVPDAPDTPDTPPILPPPKPGNGSTDSPPETANLGDQAVLYGPLFIAMLLGMLAKALFDMLDDSKPSWRSHLRHGAMAIVISPIVFLGFITAGQFNSSSQTFLVLALFAFQNGFFWQTVLKRSSADAPAPAADQAK